MIVRLLFQGQSIAYNADDVAVQNAIMFGFVKISHSTVQIANRIFESRLYNWICLDIRNKTVKFTHRASGRKISFLPMVF